MGVYVDSGSIYETHGTAGATALLECLSFKATAHRDTLRIMKEVCVCVGLCVCVLGASV
jgi:predicted Zn-dependent peptidase